MDGNWYCVEVGRRFTLDLYMYLDGFDIHGKGPAGDSHVVPCAAHCKILHCMAYLGEGHMKVWYKAAHFYRIKYHNAIEKYTYDSPSYHYSAGIHITRPHQISNM